MDTNVPMTDHSPAKKPIIVILGAGRTGTSLLTKILLAMGLSESDEYIASTTRDPDGFHEDAQIVATHKKILTVLQSPPTLAIDEKDFANPELARHIDNLSKNVRRNIQATKTVWGFKDPRTAILLPLWQDIFAREDLTPLFILSVRAPGPTVISMHCQAKKSKPFYELMWLQRTTEALYRTQANCFVAHYEDWFSPDKSDAQATGLLRFTGLNTFQEKDRPVADILAGKIKNTLNRSVNKTYTVKNRYVRKLYKQLQLCHGNDFDKGALLEVVAECREAMGEFVGWEQEAKRFFRLGNEANALSIDWEQQFSERDQLEKQLSTLLKRKKILETFPSAEEGKPRHLRESIEEANRYLQECITLSDTNTSLRVRVSVQAKELTRKQHELEHCKREGKGRNDKLMRELNLIQTSTSFKLGRLLIAAVAEPSINSTLLLPYHIFRLFFPSKTSKP